MKIKSALVILAALFSLTLQAQIVFEKQYGDTMYSSANAVKQCFDGGYIITGFTSSVTGQPDVYLIRTDSLGDTLWTRNYGIPGSGFDVIQTPDSNFVISGYVGVSTPYLLLMKVDVAGDTIWTKIFAAANGWGQALQQTFDGGLIIAGLNLYKADATGALVWTKPAAGVQAMYVIQTADSGYAMTGIDNNGNNIYLVKTDTGGTAIWTKTFAGTLENTTNNNLIQLNNGGYLLTGVDTGNGRGTLLIKTDANGDTLWVKRLPGYDGTSVVETIDGSYAIGGYDSVSDQMLLIKTDSNGIVQWTNNFGSTGSEWAKSMRQTNDGGYILAGTSTSPPVNHQDVYLVKTDSHGNAIPSSINNISEENNMLVYPNPTNSSFTVQLNQPSLNAELSIYNLYGQKVKAVTRISTDKIEIERSNIPSGLYFISVARDSKPIATSKLVITD